MAVVERDERDERDEARAAQRAARDPRSPFATPEPVVNGAAQRWPRTIQQPEAAMGAEEQAEVRAAQQINPEE